MTTAVQGMGAPHMVPGVDAAKQANKIESVAANATTTEATEGMIKRDNHKIGGDPAGSVDKANEGTDAARLNGEGMMARMEEQASMQQRFSLQQGLVEMATQMISALAKTIKNTGKAVSDLVS